MPRKKRSEERQARVMPAPVVPVAPPVVERLVAAHCPTCGRAIPKDRAIKIRNVTVDRVPYFGSIDWDPHKPFGVSYAATGRGSLADNRPINPEDAPEFFEAVKKRLIDAVREWIAKGWLKPEEIQ